MSIPGRSSRKTNVPIARTAAHAGHKVSTIWPFEIDCKLAVRECSDTKDWNNGVSGRCCRENGAAIALRSVAAIMMSITCILTRRSDNTPHLQSGPALVLLTEYRGGEDSCYSCESRELHG